MPASSFALAGKMRASHATRVTGKANVFTKASAGGTDRTLYYRILYRTVPRGGSGALSIASGPQVHRMKGRRQRRRVIIPVEMRKTGNSERVVIILLEDGKCSL